MYKTCGLFVRNMNIINVVCFENVMHKLLRLIVLVMLIIFLKKGLFFVKLCDKLRCI